MLFICKLKRMLGVYVPGWLQHLFHDTYENPRCFAGSTRHVSYELYCKYNVDYKIYSRYYEFEEFLKPKK